MRSNSTNALVACVYGGDDLLVRLVGLGFRVRRYGDRAGTDDDNGQGSVPSKALLHEFANRQDRYGELLVALERPAFGMNRSGIPKSARF